MRLLAEQARPEPAGRKAWREGTHRTVAPEATLARLLPLLPALGITRVADLTGLDTLGVPVAAAMRPNSRSLAVHQGKGLSRAAAKVSAIMEAAECHHAETIERPLRLVRPGALADAVDVRRLPRGGGELDTPFLWIEGVDLASAAPRWVPYELVHADFTAPQPAGSFLFQATTNGLAAGNEPVEAMVHALCEAVERDAIAVWRAAGGPGGRGARVLDPGDVADLACAGLLRRFTTAGVAVAIWDVTGDAGLPAYLCLLVPPDGGLAGIEPELGSGCHLDPGVALARALTEAAQARTTRISGARDDFAPASYEPAARAARLADAQGWLSLARRGRQTAFRADRAGPTLRNDLDTVLDRLRRIGCGEAVWVDLSKPALGIAAGRVVVPGLEGPFQPGEHVPGARAQAAS